MGSIICFVLLLIAAVSDIKTKEITIYLPIVGIVCGIILLPHSEDQPLLIIGFLFGLLMIFAALIFNKHFGVGDGLMITVEGLLVGINICLESVFLALIFTVIGGIIFKFTKKDNKQLQLPFLPFLLLATVFIYLGR